MVDAVSWGDVAKPGLAWLLRRLPSALFRRIYDASELERDIRVTCEARDQVEVLLPEELQRPSLEFFVRDLNASPYLD